MAFSRKKYSGPMKNRGAVNGKADVSKEELDDFRAKYGADKTLRDLLNADRTGKEPDVSKDKTPPMDEATKARVRRNKLEQAAIKGDPEIIKPVDKSPMKFGEDGKIRREKPVDMPERRRLGPKTEAPDIIKTSDKKDDTDLPLNERGRRTRERARNSDTGTDKRSVNERIKEAMGMKKGGSVRGYGMARGGKACKMR